MPKRNMKELSSSWQCLARIMTQIPHVLTCGFPRPLQESVILVPEMLVFVKEEWKYAPNLWKKNIKNDLQNS
jgi:hypothetical protein